MKPHLIKEKSISDYVTNHQNSKTFFDNWLTDFKATDWNNPEDIQSTFRRAELLGNGSSRVIFKLGGKKYRMICKYHFGAAQVHVFICWIGTHAEYTKLYEDGLQYTVSNY